MPVERLLATLDNEVVRDVGDEVVDSGVGGCEGLAFNLSQLIQGLETVPGDQFPNNKLKQILAFSILYKHLRQPGIKQRNQGL